MRGTEGALSVLIVSSSEKSAAAVAGLLNPSLCRPVYVEKTGGGTRRRLQSWSYDLVVINTPLSDEFGHELACDLCRDTTTGVILLAKTDVYDEICDMTAESGVLTVPKPISRVFFRQTIRLAASTFSRLSRYEKENSKLKQKLDESKIIDRAKCALIEFEGMTESEAHRTIEKQAMDRRVSRRIVAETILRGYER